MDHEKELNQEENEQRQDSNAISPASEHSVEEESTPETTTDENTKEESVTASESVEEAVKSETNETTDSAAELEPTTSNEESSPKTEEKPATAKIEAPQDATTSKEEVKDKTELGSEEDLAEKADDDHHHEEDEEVDYSTCTKEELVEYVKEAGKMDNVIKADKVLFAIKPFMDAIRSKEREVAYEKYIAEGGDKDAFEYRNDELNTRFDANFRLIKDKKSKYFQEKERQKDDNLKKKEEILEQLREFVDSDETNISFDTFKELQNAWRSVGNVPPAYNRTLWANYNALLDRFYDKRSIYFELKELDRRKNLESKTELCEKAEALINEEQINVATQQLNELHHDFKHIGPVPKEDQEPLWQRFKAASDAIYDRRKEFVDQMKGELDENLVKKEELADKLVEFTKYNSDRIKEWNEKTKEILAVQKEWEVIGGMPREKGKEVNKKFWGSFKQFFHNKGDFFKRLDEQRGGNLKLKEELVEQAVALKDSTDWVKGANELKKLQRQWKEIGPVPEKHRNEIYKRFKAACDFFFDQKRAHSSEANADFEENLKQKEAICAEIESLSGESEEDLDRLRELQVAFNEIGFVPKKEIGVIKSKFSEAVDKFINSIPNISNEERHTIRVENNIVKMMNEPNSEQKIFRKEQQIRKQIGKVENDIALWRNNMEFFAESKTANKLKDEFEGKIDKAAKELNQLKQELRMLRSVQD